MLTANRRRSVGVWCVAVVCGVMGALSGAARGEETALIPRRLLFGNPDRASPAISPDGKRLAWLAPVDGVLNVWVAPVGELGSARAVTRDTKRGIRSFSWAYSGSHLLYSQDAGGDENWRVYAVDVEKGETRDLTPYEGARAEVERVSPKMPMEVIVGINDRDPKSFDLYRVRIDTGERTLVMRNPGVVGRGIVQGFVVDDKGEARFAWRSNSDDGGMSLLRPDGKGGWDEALSVAREDTLSTEPLEIDSTGEFLYMTDSRGRDTSALVEVRLKDMSVRALAEDGRADVTSVLLEPTTHRPLACAFTYERVEWRAVDESVQKDLYVLGKSGDGDFRVISQTLDNGTWVVAYTRDVGSRRFVLYDRATRTTKELFVERESLAGQPLAPMRPVQIRSRDGMTLVSYLTRPLGAEGTGPMVLLVHGGPWGRDYWGYNSLHQLLANRGYSVLSVNFRSSTGFGKKFLNAGNREWAAKMHDDLLDAVDWAVREGIADKDRVAIMGGSYGGYATLVGLTFTPEVFACGVDIVGPSNLVTLLSTVPPYWAPLVRVFQDRVGDHTTEEGRAFLESRSPLTFADKIVRPLLIGQGANDPRVKQAESDQIVEAMRRRGIPVTYILFPDEGHGFARPPNSLAFFAVTERFLAEHLGGRAEEIGNAFEGSSITAPEGAAEVPGLMEALGTPTR